MTTTGLHPVTSKLVRDEWVKLRSEKIEPWLFMEFGEGLHVTDYYGRSIRYRGILFPGSPRAVFWGRYIDPFIEDIALRLLDRTATLCKEEGHDARAALPETGELLKGLVSNAFHHMADVDRRLADRGTQGAPPRPDVEANIRALNEFIDARVRGLLGALQPSQTTLQKWRSRWEQHKVGASFAMIAAAIAALATFTESVSRLLTTIAHWLRP